MMWQLADIELNRVGAATVLHMHFVDEEPPANWFAAAIEEAQSYGMRVVGEPIETDVWPECQYAHLSGRRVVRHFEFPVLEEGQDA